MKYYLQATFRWGILLIVASLFLSNEKYEDAHLDAKKIIALMEKSLGGKEKFYNMKDVKFDYTFEYVESGKKDVSEERMIFDGEHSYAKYTYHKSLVMPQEEGDVIHSWLNGKAYVFHNGASINDEKMLKSCEGIRKANYYWFTMMYKLSDPGVVLTTVGHEKIGRKFFHKVQVDYDSKIIGKEDNDAYLLYINSESNLVERFHFSIPEDGAHEGVKVVVDYKTVNGLKVPAKRSVYMPNEDGSYNKSPRLVQTSSNIHFRNGYSTEDLLPEQ